MPLERSPSTAWIEASKDAFEEAKHKVDNLTMPFPFPTGNLTMPFPTGKHA